MLDLPLTPEQHQLGRAALFGLASPDQGGIRTVDAMLFGMTLIALAAKGREPLHDVLRYASERIAPKPTAPPAPPLKQSRRKCRSPLNRVR
jgi:hypothetical protein